MKVLRHSALAAGFALLAAACSDSRGARPVSGNHAPLAHAGADRSASAGDVLSLSAAASSDPDSDALTYSWTITSGPEGAILATPLAIATTFRPAAAGNYVVSVTAQDPANASSVDSLVVAVQ